MRLSYLFFAIAACSSPEPVAAPTSLEHFVVTSIRDARREVNAMHELLEKQGRELRELGEVMESLDAEIELIKLKLRERDEIADGIEAPTGHR